MAAPETLAIEKEQGEASAVEERLPSRRKRNAAIFVPLAALWLVLDIATKAYFNGCLLYTSSLVPLVYFPPVMSRVALF